MTAAAGLARGLDDRIGLVVEFPDDLLEKVFEGDEAPR
jgi:hypothetical protein